MDITGSSDDNTCSSQSTLSSACNHYTATCITLSILLYKQALTLPTLPKFVYALVFRRSVSDTFRPSPFAVRCHHGRLFVLTAALMVERGKFANDENRTYNHEDNAHPEETGRRRFSCWIGLPELFPKFAHGADYTIKRKRPANGKSRN